MLETFRSLTRRVRKAPAGFPFVLRPLLQAARLSQTSRRSCRGPVSPSPSVLSEGRDEPERQLDEEQERRIRLQLYVFVVRCIAYPFNAKQPTDMARRQQKVGQAAFNFSSP
ncbi:hypothetical protein PANDA_007638 [Ailuropoda melanoleuca]|uniref:Uncharacterized protein n=1 Tax=Ailuropoda melanoleuca TaxID=9646 RepID=D2HAY3_AILME|nr:hypothetical protein PANDA_007638 [Ailuropoda melanoleuca]